MRIIHGEIRVHESKRFSTLDANMGYFQLALHENSHPLTCFITPFGRYMYNNYKRLHMGICVAPELYQWVMSELFSNIKGVEIVMDDILIHAPTTEDYYPYPAQ